MSCQAERSREYVAALPDTFQIRANTYMPMSSRQMGLARLFYHLPNFGVLDECTSAVSSDVEGQMYQHAKDMGISKLQVTLEVRKGQWLKFLFTSALITISHRPSLTKYHQRLLRFTGVDGTWELSTIGTEAE